MVSGASKGRRAGALPGARPGAVPTALLAAAAAAALAAAAPFPAALALDDPGLRQVVTVGTGGYEFDVVATSTFSVTGHEFSAGEKRLTLYIDGAVSENLAEITIPSNLIGGNLTFHLDGEPIPARVRNGSGIAFATVEFPGGGSHTLDIVGTTYLPEFGAASAAVLAAAAAASVAAARMLGPAGAGIPGAPRRALRLLRPPTRRAAPLPPARSTRRLRRT